VGDGGSCRLQLWLVPWERCITVMGMEEPAEHHHFLVQAPVPPADVDGLTVITVGTGIFGLVSVILALASYWLAAHDHGTWLQVSISGFTLGLIGLAYCWRRRRRRHAANG
jgi:hypothetical protein